MQPTTDTMRRAKIRSVSGLSARIQSRFEQLRLSVSSSEIDQLAAYFGLLTKWNKTVNLTAVSLDPPSDEAIERILIEPVVAAAKLSKSNGLLVDLGSGGGSPAIPLRIMSPAMRLVMIESKTRKSAFLREAVRQLNLAGAEVLTTRFEDAVAEPGQAGTASWVSVRAVRADRAFWDSVDALAAPDGRVLWFRSAADPIDRSDFSPPFDVDSQEPFPNLQSGELVVLARSTWNIA